MNLLTKPAEKATDQLQIALERIMAAKPEHADKIGNCHELIRIIRVQLMEMELGSEQRLSN